VTIYSFLNCEYGFLASVDLDSECMRFMGALRFEIMSVLKLFWLHKYNYTVIMP